MKPIRRIQFLSVVVISIIGLWLKPGINTARDTTYVRYYEDTDKKSAEIAVSDTLRQRNRRDRRIYKAERISSRDRISKITPRKFSRAIQFEDSLVLMNDSVSSIVRVDADSASSNKQR